MQSIMGSAVPFFNVYFLNRVLVLYFCLRRLLLVIKFVFRLILIGRPFQVSINCSVDIIITGYQPLVSLCPTLTLPKLLSINLHGFVSLARGPYQH